MKKLFELCSIPLAMVLCVGLCISCDDDADVEAPGKNEPEVELYVTVQAGADMVSLGEGEGTVVFPKSGGTVKLIVSSDSSWGYQPAQNFPEWLTVLKERNTFTLSAEANETADTFNHEITITAGSGEDAASYVLDISLTAQELVFSPPIVVFPSAGETIDVSVAIPGDTWNVSEAPGWIEYEKNDDLLTLTAGQYFGTEDRFDEILFISDGGEGKLEVRQTGTGPTSIVVDPVGGLVFAADGEELEVKVTTNKQWTVSSDVEWLEITEEYEGGFKAKAEPNYYAVERNDFIYVIAGEGDDERSQRIYVGQEAQPEAFVTAEDLAFGSSAGRYELAVATNQETWSYDIGNQSWLTVTRQDDILVLEYPANTAADLNTANITITAGRSENQAEATYNIKQLPGSTAKALIYEMEVPAGEEAMLPLYWVIINYGSHQEVSGHVDAIVDWGDGTLENVKDRGYPTHIWTTGGTHEVRIYGEVDMLRAPSSMGFGFEGTAAGTEGYRRRGYFTKVLQWGNLGYVQLDYACYYFHNLTHIAGDDNGSFTDVDYLPQMFYGCTSLQEIPGNLFSNISKVRIPELGGNSASFNSLFTLCTSLKKVPAGLFVNNSLAESFSMCFESCTNLEEVEDGAFGNHPKLVSVLRLFRNCTNLKKVPVDMFDGMPNVETFQWCFYNCRLEGESTYTMVGTDKVRLWERINYPLVFARPTNYDTHGGLYGGTYYNCTDLNDYNEIPDFWKAYFSN